MGDKVFKIYNNKTVIDVCLFDLVDAFSNLRKKSSGFSE